MLMVTYFTLDLQLPPQHDAHVRARACRQAFAAGRTFMHIVNEEAALDAYCHELNARVIVRVDADFRNAFRAGHRAALMGYL
jgi:hypothetical protein